MLGSWTSLVWLVLLFIPLLLMQRWINRHLQGLGLLLLGEGDLHLVLYYLLLLPGILLHEGSHWLMATLLGVKVSGISIGPSRKGRGRVRFGSVRVARTDPLRDSLIGLAPLIAGSLAILLIANRGFGLPFSPGLSPLQQLRQMLVNLADYTTAPDALLWLYLIFAISNAMLPSESDRQPWLPLVVYLGCLAALYVLVAGVPRVSEEVVSLVLRGLDYLSLAFGLTVLADLPCIGVIYLLETVVGGLRGQRVEY
ncbi:MAG TPA: hypothetical protein EYP55_06665 [Anaerolineae bacterium]|nr:hypothetical protein [Anaerolineae bacterium]